MEIIEREHFKVEIYRHINRFYAIILVVASAFFLFFFVDWIIYPERSLGLIFLFPFFAIILVLFAAAIKWRRIAVIMTRDAFIQTDLKKVVLWGDINRVEFYSGNFLKNLYVYYRENNQIRNFRAFFACVENKEQLVESLKKYSQTYGFTFKEK